MSALLVRAGLAEKASEERGEGGLDLLAVLRAIELGLSSLVLQLLLRLMEGGGFRVWGLGSRVWG